MADQEPVEGYDPEQLDKKAAAVEEAVAVGLELAAASVASDIGQQFVAGPADAVTVPGVWAQIVEDRIAPLISDIIYDTAETIRLGIADAGERLYAGEAIAPTEALDPRPIDNVTAEGLLSHATNRMNDIGNDLWLNIQQTLAEGVAQGESIPELAERVREAAPMTEARARMVARNEVISASNASSLAQARSAGVPLNKTWLATPDLRTRPSHAAAEGLTVPLDEPFMIGEPVAYPLDFPGDPSGPPSEVYGCRCTLAYELSRTPTDIITVSSVHLFTCITTHEGACSTGLGKFREELHRRDERGRFGRKSGLASGIASGIRERHSLNAGTANDVDLVTFNDGSKAIYKKSGREDPEARKREMDAEELGMHVGRAIGAPSPEVFRISDDEIYMQYVEDAMLGVEANSPEVRNSDDARRVALLDILIENPDRHTSNWLVKDGRVIPIDNGKGWSELRIPDGSGRDVLASAPPSMKGVLIQAFAKSSYPKYDDVSNPNMSEWVDNDLSAYGLRKLGENLDALEPEFERLGRGYWFRRMMQRLSQVEQHATGSRRLS